MANKIPLFISVFKVSISLRKYLMYNKLSSSMVTAIESSNHHTLPLNIEVLQAPRGLYRYSPTIVPILQIWLTTRGYPSPVSYTHLTLPTNREV